MSNDTPYDAGSSTIPSPAFLRQLVDDDRRDDFVADQVRLRLALLIRALREQRGWSQGDLGREVGKLQPNISRIEDPDYGKLSLQTLFELASAFKLPIYIDMPEWDEWFRMMSDMSSRNLWRRGFDIDRLTSLRRYQIGPLYSNHVVGENEPGDDVHILGLRHFNQVLEQSQRDSAAKPSLSATGVQQVTTEEIGGAVAQSGMDTLSGGRLATSALALNGTEPSFFRWPHISADQKIGVYRHGR